MKIFSYQRPDQQPNFGDDLNRWLWPKLAPGLFSGFFGEGDRTSNQADTVFIGTGTLLNHKLGRRIAPAKKAVIFGTGAGYERPMQSVPSQWDICCVRGPLSAKQLGLPPEKAITDGGLLIAKVFSPSNQPSGCSFMPHIHSANDAGDRWETICEMAGMRYIDPRWPIEQVLSAIGNSERLLTEAMHGAIAADALRVPWLPVVTTPRIYRFKWQDWCASMDLFYHPYQLPALKSYPRWGRGLRSGSVALKHWLGAALEGPVSTPYYELSGDESAIAKRLINIAKQAPSLSSEATFNRQIERLQHSFSTVRSTYNVLVGVR